MKKISVLIVDDDHDDRYLLRRSLEMTNMVGKVFEADDGKTAMEFFAQHEANMKDGSGDYPPTIVFLDVNMPLVGGFEFLEQFASIRGDKQLTAVVVMMYTSSEREEDKRAAARHDFVRGFVTKSSISPDDLAEKLASACG
ncbi:MAG: response regulator [Nannocystaceae bacterium]|nr:response regulator [Nannocystaceae bacterium]